MRPKRHGSVTPRWGKTRTRPGGRVRAGGGRIGAREALRGPGRGRRQGQLPHRSLQHNSCPGCTGRANQARTCRFEGPTELERRGGAPSHWWCRWPFPLPSRPPTRSATRTPRRPGQPPGRWRFIGRSEAPWRSPFRSSPSSRSPSSCSSCLEPVRSADAEASHRSIGGDRSHQRTRPNRDLAAGSGAALREPPLPGGAGIERGGGYHEFETQSGPPRPRPAGD